MDKSLVKRNERRKRRVLRVRKKLKGTAEKPRLSVSKTNKHIYVQLIDDENGKSLLGIGTTSKAMKDTKFQKKSMDAATHLGELVAKAAKDKKIDRVIFDRGRFKYHGIIAALADAARKAGLNY